MSYREEDGRLKMRLVTRRPASATWINAGVCHSQVGCSCNTGYAWHRRGCCCRLCCALDSSKRPVPHEQPYLKCSGTRIKFASACAKQEMTNQ